MKNWIQQWMVRFSNQEAAAVRGFLLFFIGFYFVTSTGNLSETDDVYAFVFRTENFPFTQVSDPRLMLYHMLMRGLYLLVNTFTGLIDWHVNALQTMRLFSIVCAGFALYLLFKIMVQHFRLNRKSALLGTLVLAFSYGFWRYAAEAEVYIPAIMFILWVFEGLLRDKNTLTLIVLLGAVAGLTVLFYQPAVIPLFFAFPFLLLNRASLQRLMLYLFVGGITVVSGYLWGFSLYWETPFSIEAFREFLSQRSEEFVVPTLSVSTVVFSIARSFFSLTHDFATANWVFASQPVLEFVNRMFPQNVIAEEIYLASQVGWRIYPLVVTQSALGLIVFTLLYQGIRRIKKLKIDRKLLVVLLWTGVNGAIIGRLNPAGLEAWIMVFPPLVLLVSVIVLSRVSDKYFRLGVAGLWLLLLHNFFGGISLVMDGDYELHRVKGEWVINQASEKDLVVVSGDAGFAETLRYLSAAEVIYVSVYDQIGAHIHTDTIGDITAQTWGRDFSGHSVAEKLTTALNRGGRVIVFEEFFYIGSPPLNSPIWELKDASHKVFSPEGIFSTYVLPIGHVQKD